MRVTFLHSRSVATCCYSHGLSLRAVRRRQKWEGALLAILIASAGCMPEAPPATFEKLVFEGALLKPVFRGDAGDECGNSHREGTTTTARGWSKTGNAKIERSAFVWLVPEEKVCAYWERFIVTGIAPGNPSRQTCTAACANEHCPPGGRALPAFPPAWQPHVSVYERPLPLSEQRNVSVDALPGAGCTPVRLLDVAPFPFVTPGQNAEFQLVATMLAEGTAAPSGGPTLSVVGDTLGVIVVPGDRSLFSMPPRIMQERPPQNIGDKRFVFEAPVVNSMSGLLLDENFSPNLRVVRVTVAKYRKEESPGSVDSVGRVVNYRLTEIESAIPYTVQPGTTNESCDYRVDPNNSDTAEGAVSIRTCFAGNRTRDLAVTPVYEIYETPPPLIDGVISPQLTWVFDFRSDGQYRIPSLDTGAGEVLAVTFILEAVTP